MLKIKYKGDHIYDGEVSGKITLNNSYYLVSMSFVSQGNLKGVLIDDNGELYYTRENIAENLSIWELDSASDIGCISLI